MKIFLLRHATPDWHRTDIPYDILPGPALVPKGKAEAQALGEFMKIEGLKKLYHSPFERASHTAQIIAEVNGIPSVEEKSLAEWRGEDEDEARVRARMASMFERAARESAELGPIGLVSHGGPIAVLLLELGLSPERLAPYRTMFDTTNPLPPAGAWMIQQINGKGSRDFQLVFTPKVS